MFLIRSSSHLSSAIKTKNMFKLVVFISSFIFVSGAIFNLPDLSELDNYDDYEQPDKHDIVKEARGDQLWVLKLDDEGMDLRTLRSATEAEKVVFQRVVEPMIEAHKYRPPRVVKQPVVVKAAEESRDVIEKRNKKMKFEMMRLINKFTTSIKSDPDAFLSDSASEETFGPSIVLYIKGVYTSLSVSSDLKEWHFFIPPPSPLPPWLYQHNDDEDLDIPDDVRDQLFVKLLRLLQLFLGHPL